MCHKGKGFLCWSNRIITCHLALLILICVNILLSTVTLQVTCVILMVTHIHQSYCYYGSAELGWGEWVAGGVGLFLACPVQLWNIWMTHTPLESWDLGLSRDVWNFQTFVRGLQVAEEWCGPWCPDPTIHNSLTRLSFSLTWVSTLGYLELRRQNWICRELIMSGHHHLINDSFLILNDSWSDQSRWPAK